MTQDHSSINPDQQRELDAFEAAFNGRPVDAEFSEVAALATALKGTAPKADPGFAAEMDRRMEDHFPAEWTAVEPDRRPLGDRLRARFSGRGRGLMLPVTAGLAGVLIIGTVVATGLNDGSDSGSVPSVTSMQGTSDTGGAGSASTYSLDSSDSAVSPGAGGAESTAPQAVSPEGVTADAVAPDSAKLIPNSADRTTGKYAYGANQRAVAHKTDIVLGTTPENVQDVSNEISSVVDDHDGIVLDSNVSDGPEGVAGASFRLLIPTNELESAVGDLSAVADLRSRSQEATDITAPTLTVEDRLQTSRAKVKSLVNELAATTTEEDRLAVEAELSAERDRVANLTTKLNRLQRRAGLTPVRVDVQTGEDFSGPSEDGSWGPADAIDDIGGYLGTAAGVALIGLAIAIPVALIALLVALVNRLWVRSARRRVIESDNP